MTEKHRCTYRQVNPGICRNTLTDLLKILVKTIREIAIKSGGTSTFDYTILKKKLDEQVFSGQQN
jgi:hypothetical protein